MEIMSLCISVRGDPISLSMEIIPAMEIVCISVRGQPNSLSMEIMPFCVDYFCVDIMFFRSCR